MEDHKKSDRRLAKTLIIAIIGVVIFWIGVTLLMLYRYGDVNSAAEFGDSFGAVNALFSSLAFAFLIYTAFMQKRELEYQRLELEETKKEIARSAEAHETLVKLTDEQLALQKRIRASQIAPELDLKSYTWITPPGVGYVFKIDFECKVNKLKPHKISIFGEDYGFSCINEDQFIGRFFDQKESFTIHLFRGEGRSFTPTNMMLNVVFEDIDRNRYKQKLIFEDNNISMGIVEDLDEEKNEL